MFGFHGMWTFFISVDPSYPDPTVPTVLVYTNTVAKSQYTTKDLSFMKI